MCGYRGDEAIAAAVIEEADWPAPAAGDAFQQMAAPRTLCYVLKMFSRFHSPFTRFFVQNYFA